ncbi:PREDICTED: olfactory receptor 1019-like [Nanorana parkeri]|uniref:olfactory receptor 1019-like n=1 Tax=Nanorana parkeri TaxID=125878 RepID=UPI00085479D6|nr:PREDICTED: olfactory receptor 1019-like [Nanorana parkeri]
MAKWNNTHFKEFILLGLTDDPKLEIILFVLFLIFYIVTLFGNIGIIIAIWVDSRLHTPMYFFLNNLSFLDLCYATIITPKTLVNFLSKSKAIGYNECAVQMFFFAASVSTECLLLGVMAYDRYVAICNPLLYSSVMAKRICMQLVAGAYTLGYLNSTLHTICTFQLPFCKTNKINHFFCDVPPLLKLSCTKTTMNEALMFIFGGFIESSSLSIIIVSYSYIISTILRIRSKEGRKKAFSTCASHLLAVTIFYSTILFMYLRPTSAYSMSQDRVASVFYSVVIPMLNPLIYSLRNNEVTQALKKIKAKYCCK